MRAHLLVVNVTIIGVVELLLLPRQISLQNWLWPCGHAVFELEKDAGSFELSANVQVSFPVARGSSVQYIIREQQVILEVNDFADALRWDSTAAQD